MNAPPPMEPPQPPCRATVLVVDDTPMNLQVASGLLRQHYTTLVATDGARALELAAREPQPAVVLLDVMMPGMDGFEVCRRLKAEPRTAHLRVIFLTALNAVADETRAFACGGVDFVSKPFQPETLLARVETQIRLHAHERELDRLVRERTAELEQRSEELARTRLEIIRRLGRAAEFKDDDTGLHVIRMSHYARLLAGAAGLPPARAEILFQAAPMHDIGKIGIPDSILKSSQPLSEAEWQVMRQHPAIGAGIIGRHDSELLECARIVALNHHERWNGSGYPRSRAGEDIPIEGRIVAIADVFDALTSVRPYKAEWPVEEAVAYLRQHSGTLFDPRLVALFLERLPEVLEIKARYSEAAAEPAAQD